MTTDKTKSIPAPETTKSGNTVKTSSQPQQKPTHHISKFDIFFSIFVVAWTIVASVGAQFIVAFPMSLLLKESLAEPGWTLVYYVLTYLLTLALVILFPPQVLKIYNKQHRQAKVSKTLEKDLQTTPKTLGLHKLPTFVDIGLAPVGYVTYLVIATILTTLMSAFTWFNADQAQNVGFQEYLSGMDQIFAMLSIVFVAPIAEEIVMRGWLYGKLRRKWSYPVAMLIVSLAFAVLHGQWNVGVSVFALSIVLCTLREITGTIWSGILLHMLSNGIAFYILYIVR